MVKEMAFICLIVVVLIVLFGTAFGKRLRLRVSGTADEAISKDASTVEGAKAYYNTAINKKEDDYKNANVVMAQMLGKIKGYEDQLRSLKKENMQLDLNINACIDSNDDDGAKNFLNRQDDVVEKIEIIKAALAELKENAELQEEVVKALLDELNDLKAEKENAILTLETAQVTKSLKATSISSDEEDKMLEKVRDGVKKTKEEADGNRIVYESSVAVQQKRLDQKMKDEEIQKKLEKLKAGKKK